MEIYVAEHAGFCFGVKRAIDMAEASLSDLKGPLFSLGPLIHNPQAVALLEKKGIRPIEDIRELDNGNLILRSHGVSPEILKLGKSKGLTIIDATCPFVEKAQHLAETLYHEGYKVIVVGDENHPEVIALVGWTEGTAVVVENSEDALKLPKYLKIGVVAQTTQTENNFQEVVEVLRKKAEDLVVYNTICLATRERQEAAVELAGQVDVMLVLGGRNSSNTRKLAKVCEGRGTTTYHIERAEELSPWWFNNRSRVGVTAGASTPVWIIEEVVQRMKDYNEFNEFEEDVTPEEEITAEAEAASKVPEPNEDEYAIQEIGISDMGTAGASEEAEAAPVEPEAERVDEASQAVEAHLADNLKNIKRGEIVSGTVVQINENEVLVDVGGKSEGIIPLGELSLVNTKDPKEGINVGDEIEVQVLRVENEDGNPVLSKKRADRRIAWEGLEDAFETGTELKGKVIEVVKGGLLVDVGVRGFVPASLVERGYVADLNQYLDQELRLRVIELDRGKNKIVLSQKAILDEEYESNRVDTWDTLEEGQTRKGVVRRITDFGAFVDLGGVDGLLHVSEIAWGRVDHPADVLSEGQELEVYVLSVDKTGGKVSLGLKQLQRNPWEIAAEKFTPGIIVQGKVLRLAPFGAFVEVESGVEGLVHISQLAEEHVEKTEDVVSVGDIIQVKVLSVDPVAQRMSLSIRQTKETEKKHEEKERERPAKKKEFVDQHSYTEEDSGITIGDLINRDIFEGMEENK